MGRIRRGGRVGVTPVCTKHKFIGQDKSAKTARRCINCGELEVQKIKCPLCHEAVDKAEMVKFDGEEMCAFCAEVQFEERSMRDYWQKESNQYKGE